MIQKILICAMSGYFDDSVGHTRNNYDSTGSREPIWTRVAEDPDDEIRVKPAKPSPQDKVSSASCLEVLKPKTFLLLRLLE